MKSFRYRLFKRIFIYCLCTTLIFSNIFISYSMTVCATEYSDLLRDGAEIALSALGIYATVQSGGALSLPLLIPYIERLAGTGFDVHDYITQNEDGTTTISEDFVQLVLQAYKECVEENFDGNIHQDEESMYYVYGGANLYLHTPYTDYRRIVNSFTYAYPIAYLFVQNSTDYKYMWWGQSNYDPSRDNYGYCIIAFAYNGNPDSSNGGIFKVDSYSSLFGKDSSDPISIYYKDGEEQQRSNSVISGASVSSGSVPLDASHYATISTSGIPVYTSFDMMREDFYNGNYTHADNYGGNFGQTSKYTGTYGGGDIKVTTEKLNGIQEKLDEINETDKSIDDKLKDLLDWLGIGDGIGGGVTGGSWYDQILAYLDKILKQLKSIKRWTIVDTVINGVDAIADWLDLIHDILSDVDDGMESAVATLSSALDDSMGLMKKKFPFSIPWDILFFVTVLSAEPEVPQFSIPFDFEVSALDLEVHYDMELDFTPFQWLSDLSRLLLSMTYAVGLMKMTFNVSNMGKEG